MKLLYGLLFVPVAAAFFMFAGTGSGVSPDGADPTCTVSPVNPGPPESVTFTLQDTGSGLLQVNVMVSNNATTTVPSFTTGTTDPVVVTSTKTDPSKGMAIKLQVRDVAGGSAFCRSDVAGPTCAVQVTSVSPKVVSFTVQDTNSGLFSIQATQSENANVSVPPFTQGTTQPVVVTASKVDQGQYMAVRIAISDQSDNSDSCRYYDGPATPRPTRTPLTSRGPTQAGTPTSTETVTPTETATAATVTPTASPTATATASSSPTPSSTAPPTPTFSPGSPTATAAPTVAASSRATRTPRH